MMTETPQRVSLREALPNAPGLRLASRYIPASTSAGIGGDWYDAFVLPSGEVGLAIGDVAGHGLHAASVMGKIRNALRAYAVEAAAPSEVMARLARLMKPFGIEDMVTLLYGVMDVGLSSFRFAAAGHLPPVVVTRDRARFAHVQDVDPPLGIGRSHAFTEHVVPLEPGASLLLYTDGLIERREESLTDGLDRLRDAVASAWDARDPEAAIATVLSAVSLLRCVARSVDGSPLPAHRRSATT